jgi:hypothetical protein
MTFFETIGWLGVMERESGSPLPDKFKSIPGGVYPMYHVFADVGEAAGSDVARAVSTDPLRVDGVVLGNRILLANLTPDAQTVTIAGVNGAYSMKSLDGDNAESAMSDPEGFRAAAGATVQASGNNLQLELKPYAYVRLDKVSS